MEKRIVCSKATISMINIVHFLIVSLKWIQMPFQYDKLLETQIAFSLESESSSLSEINRPVAVTSFLFIKNFKFFVSLCNKFRTKIIIWSFRILFTTTPPKKFHSPKRIIFSNHNLHKSNKKRMKRLLFRMM